MAMNLTKVHNMLVFNKTSLPSPYFWPHLLRPFIYHPLYPHPPTTSYLNLVSSSFNGL